MTEPTHHDRYGRQEEHLLRAIAAMLAAPGRKSAEFRYSDWRFNAAGFFPRTTEKVSEEETEEQYAARLLAAARKELEK